MQYQIKNLGDNFSQIYVHSWYNYSCSQNYSAIDDIDKEDPNGMDKMQVDLKYITMNRQFLGH